ncbi:MAG: hypothetical protein KAI66_18380 [Lentisphaeria bacterium]|nr:hypothetical protein [Lentisphaeria bacterium]
MIMRSLPTPCLRPHCLDPERSQANHERRGHLDIALLVILFFFTLSLSAQTVRTQTIELQAGWNAIFIEVEPAAPAPADVFEGAPVEIVSTYFADKSPVEFIRDPDEQSWTDSGWSTWYAPERDDAFLSKLHAIQANQPYLVKMSAAHSLIIEGEVKFKHLVWQPSSLNFVGFHVHGTSPPTFETFFADSTALAGQRVYKLVDGHWRIVTNPTGETIQAGTAYWVYCKKGSAHQGPLTVAIPYGDSIDFGGRSTIQTINMTNTGTDPVDVTITDLGRTLPMAYRVYDPDTGETTYTDLPASLAIATLDPGGSYTLSLLVKREDFTEQEQSTILKIATDSGVILHVAVLAKDGAE